MSEPVWESPDLSGDNRMAEMLAEVRGLEERCEVGAGTSGIDPEKLRALLADMHRWNGEMRASVVLVMVRHRLLELLGEGEDLGDD